MRTSTSCLLALAVANFGARAINLADATDAPARVLEFPIQRRHVSNPIEHDRQRLRKRDDTLSVSLANEETLYFMNASIGTPAQNFRLHIDTGSSDLWVNVASSQLCESDNGQACSVSGTYNANKSSTYHYLNSNFNITYVDGSGSSGDYVTDVVSFGGVTIKDQQFGIGYASSSSEGILGIGYPINEVAVAYNGGQPYANVPQSLLNDGVVATNAYSLWLNDLDASTGSILFGGVNSDKYTGSLQTLPIIKEQGVYAEFIIALTGVGMNGNSGNISSNIAVPALLDSGSSLMYLPNDVAQGIWNSVGASYDSSQNAAIVPCSLANSGMTVDFTFSGVTISVGMDELVIVAAVERGQEVCILGIGPVDGSTPVLGDTFLRSAYVVYDLTANEISLAQTKFNTTSDNIQEITNSTIPGATKVQNAVTSVAVSSGGARIGSGGITTTIRGAAQPTAAPAYNVAWLGAAGAMAVMAL